ncbi:MAG: hypothetical protein K2J66_07165 [Muribaculaceae bacterium]|nr:hypothetical protein [Muribaculaceae bacterium]
MKKKIIFTVALFTTIVAAAEVEWTGHCGEKAVTVGEEYFGNKAEAEEYYHDLNMILCGSDGEFELRRDF